MSAALIEIATCVWQLLLCFVAANAKTQLLACTFLLPVRSSTLCTVPWLFNVSCCHTPQHPRHNCFLDFKKRVLYYYTLSLPSTPPVIFHSLIISPWFRPYWPSLAEPVSAVVLWLCCWAQPALREAVPSQLPPPEHSWWGTARLFGSEVHGHDVELKIKTCHVNYPLSAAHQKNDFGAQGRRYHFNNLLIKWPRLPKLKSTLLLWYTRSFCSITPNIRLHNYSKPNFILKVLLKPKRLSKSPCLKKAKTRISLEV